MEATTPPISLIAGRESADALFPKTQQENPLVEANRFSLPEPCASGEKLTEGFDGLAEPRDLPVGTGESTLQRVNVTDICMAASRPP